MINNDTEPPKNNYTQRKIERGIFKVAVGESKVCLFKTWPLAIGRGRYTSGLTAAQTVLTGPDSRMS